MAGGRSAVSDDAMDRFVFGVDQENILTAWIVFFLFDWGTSIVELKSPGDGRVGPGLHYPHAPGLLFFPS